MAKMMLWLGTNESWWGPEDGDFDGVPGLKTIF